MFNKSSQQCSHSIMLLPGKPDACFLSNMFMFFYFEVRHKPMYLFVVLIIVI